MAEGVGGSGAYICRASNFAGSHERMSVITASGGQWLIVQIERVTISMIVTINFALVLHFVYNLIIYSTSCFAFIFINVQNT